MVFRAFGPHAWPVSTTMRGVNGSRAEAELKESRAPFEMRVPVS